MNIAEAKQHIKDTIEAYYARDDEGMYCIEPAKQRPVFLLGAPGIGKTAIIAQVAQELGVGLVSYSMTHHTRQSALGLPLIVHREFEGFEYESSEYTMSEIVASVYDYMKDTGVRRGILFLDEINCVSETLYPSMLQFLQFKTFGRHRIPDDWIVVCAGNPPEYNKSVHEFDIVTLDRLRRMEVEPDYEAWRTYAVDHGIHPAVVSFLDVKKECFYSVVSTPAGKRFATARGWEDLSEVIKLFERLEKPIDKSLVAQFLQDDDISDRFATYYELFNKYRSDYQVASILAGQAPEAICTRALVAPFDERLALIGLILDKLTGEMADVLSREAVVAQVRDILREVRPLVEQGATVEETLGKIITERKADLDIRHGAGMISDSRVRRERRIINALEALCNACTLAGAPAGEQAFALVQDGYRTLVADLNDALTQANAHVANAFAFVDAVFEEDRESLVFVTELTARKASAQFINRFGCESYYAHNEGMKVADHRQALQERIDALNLDSVEAAAAAVTDDAYAVDALTSYYANAPVEYGYASMCKMTLPDNLTGKTVLDVGCRRGKGVFKLSERVGAQGQVYGVEWSRAYVEEARERSEQAWRKNGLAQSNMTFLQGCPERLVQAGVPEQACDVVFVNSVVNLAFEPAAAFAEFVRVLAPGGMLVCETSVADAPRDERVVEQAKKLGNSIQAAPYRTAFENLLKQAGFETITYVEEQQVAADQGYKEGYVVPTAPSEETVRFSAVVVHAFKAEQA